MEGRKHPAAAGSMDAARRVALAVAVALSGLPVVTYAGEAAAPAEVEELAEVTVTGSRILRRDLEASSPVVTVEREAFTNSAYTSIEQVLNELPQFVAGSISGGNAGLSGEFAAADVQPSATNSPGAATINLRGIGANRSLTLIDGRRGQPSNASLTIDLNTIPSSAIASVEVVSGGASAVYGADALGGVTNFKLRDNFRGMELSARGGINQEGDGEEHQLSTLLGTSLGEKGSAMVSMEWFERKSALRGNRPWFTNRFNDPTIGATNSRLNFPSVEFGGVVGGRGPSSTASGIVTGNTPSQAAINDAFPTRPFNIPINSTVYFNRDGTPFLMGGASSATTQVPPGGLGFNSGPLDGWPYKVSNNYNGTGGLTGTTLGENDLEQWLSSPMERFSLFGRAKYSLNDHVRAYSQVNFVASSVRQRLQPTGATGNFSAAIPHGTEIYLPSVAADGSTKPEYRAGGPLGLNCAATGGCTLSQAFPTPLALTSMLDSRAGAPASCVVKVPGTNVDTVNPLTGTNLLNCGQNSAWRLAQTLSFLPTRGTENTQRLYQLIAGLEGDLGLGDWTWEAYVSHGNTLLEATYIGYPSTEQYRAIVQAPNYGRNYTSPTYLNSKSATCTSGLPIFEQFAVSQDCIDAIVTDSTDRSTLNQDVYEANFQGTLAELPAGPMGAAFGLSRRVNDYVFRPDPVRATNYIQDVGVGQFGAVKSGGETSVNELYGELIVPLLRGLPAVNKLELELGYRYSMYNSGAGDVPTWKALLNWAPLSWMNVRGGYQKANRAPNIAELYLGETTIVTFQGVDPCRSGNTVQQAWYNNDTNPNRAQLQALCSAQIGNAGSDFDVDPDGFNAGGGGLGVQLGNPNLKSESGETWTVGTVFRSPFDHPLASNLTASVDYFKAKITDNIGLMGAQEVLDACFNRQGENPNYVLDDEGGNCARIQRDQFSGVLSRVETPYANLGGLEISGMDFSVNWSAPFADMGLESLPGRVSLGLQATRNLHYISQTTTTSAPLENVGFSNLPKWRGVMRAGYRNANFSAGLSWRMQSDVKSGALQTNPNSTTIGGPFYGRLDGNVGYRWGIADLTFSISNLTNKAPPHYGYSPWTTGEGTQLPSADLVGRRFSAGVTINFE